MIDGKSTRFYISSTGTVHLSMADVNQIQQLVCTTMPVRMAGTRHLRYAGHPTREDLDEQRTVDALEGTLNKKMSKREPKLVCVNCFPVDPMVVGVV